VPIPVFHSFTYILFSNMPILRVLASRDTPFLKRTISILQDLTNPRESMANTDGHQNRSIALAVSTRSSDII
jgi:hypothetical protein